MALTSHTHMGCKEAARWPLWLKVKRVSLVERLSDFDHTLFVPRPRHGRQSAQLRTWLYQIGTGKAQRNTTQAAAWLKEDPTRRAVLFHTAGYREGCKLFAEFPAQTTFGDIRPVLE
jgi:hypothetical protein